MRVILSLLTGAALLASGSAAVAQDKPAPRDGERKIRILTPEGCETGDGKVECRIFRRADMDSAMAKRAVLGVEVSSTGSVRDSIGVFVARVTPKGPAETAGIVEGDRIVSVNGVDLRLNSADAGDGYASGLAARRLTREMQKLSPGSRVNLRVWSGGRVRDVQVTAGRASDLRDSRSFGFMFDGIPGGMFGGEMPRLRIESFPRLRMEAMPRIHIDGIRGGRTHL